MSTFPRSFLVAIIGFALGCFAVFLFRVDPNVPSDCVNTPSPAEPPEVQKPLPTADDFQQLNIKSPYDIESFINDNPKLDIVKLWDRLGIAGKTNMMPGWQSDTPFMESCEYCQADTYHLELTDNSYSGQLLMRIKNGTSEECRYLLFDYILGTADWRLVGFVDHDFGRYRMPEHALVQTGGHTYLSIRVQTASGSGVAMYFDRLFALKDGKLVELLDFPANGHNELFGEVTDQSFSGKVANITKVGNGYRVEIALTADYWKWREGSDNDIPLFTKRQRAVFDWKPDGKLAKLNKSLSNVSERELADVYDVDQLSYRDFERYNRSELKRSLGH